MLEPVDKMKKPITYALIALAIIILILSFYRCPLYFFLGIPCPFCGMTRAFLCVLNGEFMESFYFHPLWPLVIVAGIIFILVKIKILKLSGKAVNILAFIAAFLFLLCFILRHVYHSPIVQIDLSKGILF